MDTPGPVYGDATQEPGKHCCNREYEWTGTVAILGMGIIQVIWPDATAASKFQFMLNFFGAFGLTCVCLLTGYFRAVALYLNGGFPWWGVRIRMVTAFLSAIVFLQMLTSLIMTQYANSQPPSIALAVYLSLAWSELRSVRRARADARFR